MSKTFTIEKATKVSLRGRISTSGDFVSLYMDWGSGKNRGTDWQFDRIYHKPKTQEQKKHNNTILQKAKEVLSLKNTELLKDNTQLINNKSLLDLNSFIEIVKKRPNKGGEPKSTATVAVYECVKKHLNTFKDFDKIRLRDIDRSMIRDIRDHFLNSELDINSAAIYFSKFGSVLSVAVELEHIDKNPYLYVDKIIPNDSEVNYIFHEDLIKLKDAHCNDPMLKKAGLFASQTGMRCGDIKLLRWKRITKVDNFYRIQLTQEKTDKPYTVHFKQPVMDILGEPGEPDDLIFPKFKNNNEANANIDLWFAKAKIEPRGYPDNRFTMHDFRHTFAITLGLNGANLYEISQLLGHRSIKTTERYYDRILEQMKTHIVDKMPELK